MRPSELSNGLEHLVSRTTLLFSPHDKRTLVEPAQKKRDRTHWHTARTYRLDRIDVAATGKEPQAVEECLLGRCKKLVTPFESRAQSSVAGQSAAIAFAQKSEPVVEHRSDLFWLQRSDTCRR